MKQKLKFAPTWIASSSLLLLGLTACSGGDDEVKFRNGTGGAANGSGGTSSGSGGASNGSGGASNGSGGASNGSGGASNGSGGASNGSGGAATGGSGGTPEVGPQFGELFGDCIEQTDCENWPDTGCNRIATPDGEVKQCLVDWVHGSTCDPTTQCAAADVFSRGTLECVYVPDPWFACILGCTGDSDCPTGLQCKRGSIFGGAETDMCLP